MTMNHPSASAREQHVLLIERTFNAPPELVFSLWADAKLAQCWWRPKGYTTPAFEMDFREGGHYRYCIHKNDAQMWALGVFREIVPGKRLVFSFRWDSGDATHDADTLITVTFEPMADNTQTRMAFRQEPFATAERRDNHTKGWGQVLDALDAFVAETLTQGD